MGHTQCVSQTRDSDIPTRSTVHIIRQLADDIAPNDYLKVNDKINEMNAAIDFIKNHCLTNSNEINQLKLMNGKLKEVILDLKVNNDKLKADLDGVSEKIKSHETH